MSMNGVNCVINIYAEGWTGAVTALTKSNPASPGYPAEEPFYYEESNSKDILTPIRHSTGYIKLIEMESGGLNDIMPEGVLDRYVEFIYGSTVMWRGYIQQQEFDSKFGGNPLVREFPVVSALGLAGDITFPVYSPPVLKSFKELIQDAISQLGMTYTAIIMPDSAGLDVSVSSLSVCPYNGNHTYAMRNTEPLFAPKTIAWFIEGICNLYGFTVREVGTVILFSAYNYMGEYIAYGISEGTILTRTTANIYGDDEIALTDSYTLRDTAAKLSAIDPVKTVNYSFDGSTQWALEHDFAADTYASSQNGGNTTYVFLSPAPDTFGSARLITAGASGTNYNIPEGIALLVWGNMFDRDKEEGIVYRRDSAAAGAQLFWQRFAPKRLGYGLLRLHVEWGVPGDFGNEELTDNLTFSLVITARVSGSTSPSYYLHRNHGQFTWQESGTSFEVAVGKDSGDIIAEGDQPYTFIPVPIPGNLLNIYVNVSVGADAHLDQKGYYLFDLRMEGTQTYISDGYSYYGDLASAVVPEITTKSLNVGTTGKTKSIQQAFNESLFADCRLIPSGTDISLVTPTVVGHPQTRLRGKFTFAGTPRPLTPETYINLIRYWQTSMRWRLVAARFSPRDDEYQLTLHRSITIESNE